jgi:hypothetical protein
MSTRSPSAEVRPWVLLAACVSFIASACGAQPAKAPVAIGVPAQPITATQKLLAHYGLAPDYKFARALPDCPMQVPETTLATMPTAQGVAFVFSTRGSPLEVRLRASEWARDYEEQTIAGLPPLTTSVVQLPDGARVDIRAVWEKDTERAREYLRQRAEDMRASGSCPGLARNAG